MKLWNYKHYKWKFYEVFGLALHSETREKLVVYKCLYENPELTQELWVNPFFVRPYDMFNEKIEFEWKILKRFEFVEIILNIN